MSAYPEDLAAHHLCHIEGHVWDGGTCSRCGERLRCVCGQFMTVDGFDAHAPHCPSYLKLVREADRDACEHEWLPASVRDYIDQGAPEGVHRYVCTTCGAAGQSDPMTGVVTENAVQRNA